MELKQQSLTYFWYSTGKW